MSVEYIRIASKLSAAVSLAHEAHEKRCVAIGALANQKVQIVHQEATGQVEASKAKLHEDLRAAEVQAQSETDTLRMRLGYEADLAAAATMARGLQIQVAELRQKYEPDVKADEPEAEPDETDEDDLDEEEEDEEDDDSESGDGGEPEWNDTGDAWECDEDQHHFRRTIPMVTGKNYRVTVEREDGWEVISLTPFTGFVDNFMIGTVEGAQYATKINAAQLLKIIHLPDSAATEGAP